MGFDALSFDTLSLDVLSFDGSLTPSKVDPIEPGPGRESGGTPFQDTVVLTQLAPYDLALDDTVGCRIRTVSGCSLGLQLVSRFARIRIDPRVNGDRATRNRGRLNHGGPKCLQRCKANEH